MSINIGSYQFEGPYSKTSSLDNRAGVYAILCDNGANYTVVDIGESAAVRSRIETHDRKTCWNGNCRTNLSVAVLYTPHQQQSGRMLIEQELRRQYSPSCGSR